MRLIATLKHNKNLAGFNTRPTTRWSKIPNDASATRVSRKLTGNRHACLFSLCLPAYNEEQNLETTIRSALSVLDALVTDCEIVVVDDGSRDATSAIVQRIAEHDVRVRLVRHPVNRGYGAAVASALQASRGDLALLMDSDGQFDLQDVHKFLDRISDFDFGLGIREQRAETGIRRINAWLWNRLVRIVIGVKVVDLDCGFKLFKRRALDAMNLTATGACISAQILMECRRLELRICELPVRHYQRKFGTPTGANLFVIARAFRELVALKFGI
jgi:glycosyltransferase involved in cell wall biosynthesis